MGEARHPGPPRPITDEEEEEMFGDGETPGEGITADEVVNDLFLMAEPTDGNFVELDETQKSDGNDTTVVEIHVGPEVEFMSPMEVDVLVDGDHELHSKPYGRGGGKHTDIFVG